jgi:hypothetical protein
LVKPLDPALKRMEDQEQKSLNKLKNSA